MRIHLNGWQRIGVVLSLLWTFFVCGSAAYDYADKRGSSSYFYEVVKVDNHAPVGHPTKLKEKEPQDVTTESPWGNLEHQEHHFLLGRLILTILIPVLVAWMVAYIFIFIVRWIARGFRKTGV